jgi:hypothetical protein
VSQSEPGAVVDLLGVLAYAELTAFDRLAEDARLAPTLTGRAALARMAAAEIAHHVRLTDRLAELGSDPAAAMAPFTSALDTFHESTRPSTWLEGLVKAYVGDGLAADWRLAGRLALWGRRLVGEAITRSQAVIAEHDGLAELIITGTGDLAGVGRLIDRITSAHTQRMTTLGLNP